MKKPTSIAYLAKVETTGGREGHAISDDEKLVVKLSTPKELGGAGGEGTNPEQLFAAGYSACFIGAMQFVAAKEALQLPDDISVVGHVGIGPIEGGFAIDVDLFIKLPGLDIKKSKDLIKKAHEVCPYSNATRDNIEVRLHLLD